MVYDLDKFAMAMTISSQPIELAQLASTDAACGTTGRCMCSELCLDGGSTKISSVGRAAGVAEGGASARQASSGFRPRV